MKLRSSTIVASIDTATPERPSNSPKIPFRPRKIRKLCSETPNPFPTVPKLPSSLSSGSSVEIALHHLRTRDPLLAAVIAAHRRPAFDSGDRPYLSLSRSILYQQLATKAAKAIYDRFVSLFSGGEPGVIPSAVLSVSAAELRRIGVSARKANYLHDLADKYEKGILSDSSILAMNDEELIRVLTAVKGIGVWSVHMFMIFALHRPDVLPTGDLGVRKGVKLLYGLKDLPGPLQMENLCEKWRPYRSVGSWYMWRLTEATKSSTVNSPQTEADS